MKNLPEKFLNKARQKRSLGAILLITVGILTLCCAGTLTDYAHGIVAGDGIYIPNATHRFSTDEVKGGMYIHTFRIYNLRPRVLRIEAQPDCGCTGLSWDNAEIAPFAWQDLTGQMRATAGNSNSVAIALQTNIPNKKWAFLFLQN